MTILFSHLHNVFYLSSKNIQITLQVSKFNQCTAAARRATNGPHRLQLVGPSLRAKNVPPQMRRPVSNANYTGYPSRLGFQSVYCCAWIKARITLSFKRKICSQEGRFTVWK